MTNIDQSSSVDQCSEDLMEMAEDSSGDRSGLADDRVLQLHSSALHLQHHLGRAPPAFEDLQDEGDEVDLVDLHELSTLSDGDLCMGRQLEAAMAGDGSGQPQAEDNAGTITARNAHQQGLSAHQHIPERMKWPEKEEPESEEPEEGMAMEEEPMMGPVNNHLHDEEEQDKQSNQFLPTEAVEQFLRGMSAGGERAEGVSLMPLATVKEEELGEEEPETERTRGQNQQQEMNSNNNINTQQTPSASSSEGRPTASPAAPEFTVPPPPPIVISPQEVDHISITLEKNQQCACKDCGKLFNSVWYLKQHAVKHSNDRPFKCRFCMKTYKFRSNLYQHKCPERNRLLLAGEFSLVGHPYRRRAYNRQADKLNKNKNNNNINNIVGDSAAAGSSGAISVNTMPNGGDHHHHLYSPPSSAPSGIFGQMDTANGGPGLLMMHDAQIPSAGTPSMADQLNGAGMGHHPHHNFSSMEFSAVADIQLQHTDMAFHLHHPPDPSSSSSSFDGYHPPFGQSNYGDKIAPPSSFSADPSSLTQQISARERELPAELIEEYMRRNRHRVFNCRKCKLYFPSREYFARHCAYHNELEEFKYCCAKCPERFQSDAALQSHQLQHADQSPHCCVICNGVFRSALALRRHKDNWRQCHSPSFGMQFSLAVNPIDQYSFVESDLDELEMDRSEEEEEETEDDRRRENVLLENDGAKMRGESADENDTLSRKTTRDSGYQGSDTYSPPTESNSPLLEVVGEEDKPGRQQPPAQQPKRDDQGRFVPEGMSRSNNGGKKRCSRGTTTGPRATAATYCGQTEMGDADKNNNNSSQPGLLLDQ